MKTSKFLTIFLFINMPFLKFVELPVKINLLIENVERIKLT